MHKEKVKAPSCSQQPFEQNFSLLKINRAIKKAAQRKAPGPDSHQWDDLISWRPCQAKTIGHGTKESYQLIGEQLRSHLFWKKRKACRSATELQNNLLDLLSWKGDWEDDLHHIVPLAWEEQDPQQRTSRIPQRQSDWGPALQICAEYNGWILARQTYICGLHRPRLEKRPFDQDGNTWKYMGKCFSGYTLFWPTEQSKQQ